MNNNKNSQIVRELPCLANYPNYTTLLSSQNINLAPAQKRKFLNLSPADQRTVYFEILARHNGGYYR